MADIDLILKDVSDPWIKENFSRIRRYIQQQTVLDGNFKFFEVDIPEASTEKSYKHNLSFVPRDIIILNAEGDLNFYFNYNLFDRDNLYITTSGPVVIRFLAGLYSYKSYGNKINSYPFVPLSIGGGGGGGGCVGCATEAKQDVIISLLDEILAEGLYPKDFVTTYGEVLALAAASTSNIVSYTVPVGKVFYIESFTGSGENLADYEMTLDGVTIDKTRTYYTDLAFTLPQGYKKCTAGQVIVLKVTNFQPTSSNFEGKIIGVLKND
jgi:hypothetical protein